MSEAAESPKGAIKVVAVEKTYLMGEVKVPVLKGVNAEILPGRLTVILGASGSGKSTLMNMIGGIDRPSSGEIWFGEREISRLNDSQLTLFRRQSVGFVFQFYNLVPTLTALENVQVSTEIAEDPMDPVEALEKVGLGERLDHFPAQMSGGQQQRVAIARALAKRPGLMLCDEPTGALDHETSLVVLELLQRLNRETGTTIVMITHAPEISQMAHRVLEIRDGRIERTVDNGTPRSPQEIQW